MESIALGHFAKKGTKLVEKAQKDLESAVREAIGEDSSDEEDKRHESQPLVGRNGRPATEAPGFFVDYIRPCCAEFVGTTIFVFVGTMSVASGVLLNIALGHGLAILLLVVIFGGISGGHFNPAVTLGVALCGGMRPVLAPCYVLCQLIGAMLGAAFTRGCLQLSVYKSVAGGATLCGDGTSPWQGLLTETALTFILVSAVVVAAVGYQHPLAPVAIGLALAVSIMAGGPVTGASLNPARSLGPAVVATNVAAVWRYHWIYWAGPVLGSVLASANYRFVFAPPQSRLIFKGTRRT